MVDLNPWIQYGALGIMLAACLKAISWMTQRFITFLEERLKASEGERDRFREIIDRQSDTLAELNRTIQTEIHRRALEASAIKDALDDVCQSLRRLS